IEAIEAQNNDEVNTSSIATSISPEDKWRNKCKDEEKLKKKYYVQVTELKAKVDKLETINNTLMYRVYELQDSVSVEVAAIKGVK
ncbi:hypothetical protein AB4519_22570, partial [Vibrio splendidus]